MLKHLSSLPAAGLCCLSVVLLGSDITANKADQARNDYIKQILPREFANFEQAVAGGSQAEIAKSALQTLKRATETVQKAGDALWDQEPVKAGYRAAWQLCLRVRRVSNSPEAKRLIDNEWEKSLQQAGPFLPYQLYALWGGEWDRLLLTDSFWRLLHDSRDPKIISAICFILYEYGDLQDMKALEIRVSIEKKRGAADSRLLSNILWGAISWIRWKHQVPEPGLDGQTNAAPVFGPPSPEDWHWWRPEWGYQPPLKR